MYDDDLKPEVPQPLIVDAAENEDSKVSEDGSIVNQPREAINEEASLAQPTLERMEERPGGIDILPYGGAPKIVTAGEEKPYDEATTRCPESYGNGCQTKTTQSSKKFSIGLLGFAGWVVCLLLVLWLFSLSSPFIAGALTCKGWRSYVSLAIATLPFLAVLSIMIYALVRFRKVPSVVQFDSSKQNKPQLQRDLAAKYLAVFPDTESYAEANGYDGKLRQAVVGCLRRLRGETQALFSDSAGWLEEFKQFQRIQDERASEIIMHYWKIVGIQTAASPWKVVDMLSVVYNSTAMISRLAALYNRRTSPQGAFRLVCRWLVNIFAAGELGDVAAGVAEVGGGAAAASLNGIADWLSAFMKPVSAILGKVAEGGANAFLTYRLGQKAITYFRPLK